MYVTFGEPCVFKRTNFETKKMLKVGWADLDKKNKRYELKVVKNSDRFWQLIFSDLLGAYLGESWVPKPLCR